jgi:hypothetical protein
MFNIFKKFKTKDQIYNVYLQRSAILGVEYDSIYITYSSTKCNQWCFIGNHNITIVCDTGYSHDIVMTCDIKKNTVINIYRNQYNDYVFEIINMGSPTKVIPLNINGIPPTDFQEILQTKILNLQ